MCQNESHLRLADVPGRAHKARGQVSVVVHRELLGRVARPAAVRDQPEKGEGGREQEPMHAGHDRQADPAELEGVQEVVFQEVKPTAGGVQITFLCICCR